MKGKLYLIVFFLILGILSSVFIALPVLADAPTVMGISPSSGPTSIGTSVTIYGTGFYGGGSSSAVSSVTIGGNSATSVSVTSDTTLTATTPTGSAGTVDVVVTTSEGSSAPYTGFTYYDVPVPTVASITPNSGPTTGSTPVTIHGTGFYGGGSSPAVSSVTIGGNSATSVSVTSDTTLTATTPTGSAGTVDVVIITSGGSTTLTNGFTYYNVPVPTVTSITPNSGPTIVSTPVTIHGTGFYGGGSNSAVSSVTIGGNSAASVSVTSDTTLTATTPTGSAGTVDVVIITSGGSATLTNGFTYYNVPVPTITSIIPNSGPLAGGTSITITGTGFYGGGSLPAVSAVEFGSTSVTPTVNSDTQITVTSPAGSGIVDVTVTTPGGTSATSSADQFTYITAPAITSISPTGGPLAGGTTVTITGTGFYGGGSSPAVSAVKFGSTSASSFTVNSATQVTATSPAGSGIVDVTVTTPGGTSATTAADGFTYSTAPTVASITPTGGPLAGGTTVTITGTGFISGATVKIGGTAASNVVVTNATTITATTPAGTAGAKSIVVTNADTQSSNTNIAFTYAAAPTIISITPNSGSAAGGTAVTITGTGFVNGSTIIIGVNQATNITVKSDNTHYSVHSCWLYRHRQCIRYEPGYPAEQYEYHFYLYR